MKRCTRCGEDKPTTQFVKRARSRDGFASWCRPCTSTYRAEHYRQVCASEPHVSAPRICHTCHTEKPASEFYLRARGARLMSRCKDCWKARQRRVTALRNQRSELPTPPETLECLHCRRVLPRAAFAANRTTARGFQSRCRDCHREQRYGMSRGEYAQRLDDQRGVCAICGEPPSENRELEVDHCHEAGSVRGLLCGPCNRLLGAARDSAKTLLAAVEYLEGGGFVGSRL
jgi:hypothetical protein